MADLDYRESFANRLRNLRIAAGLSLEEASGRGGLSTNFWGSVERNEKEPCLNTIFSLAKGLGITPDVLIALEDKDRQTRIVGNWTACSISSLLRNCSLRFRYRS